MLERYTVQLYNLIESISDTCLPVSVRIGGQKWLPHFLPLGLHSYRTSSKIPMVLGPSQGIFESFYLR